MPQGERHVHPHPERAGVMYPFVGIPTFLRSALCTDLDKLDADIAIMGAPTDEGSPFMPGSWVSVSQRSQMEVAPREII